MKRFKNILYVNEPTVDQASAIARAVSLVENNQADQTRWRTRCEISPDLGLRITVAFRMNERCNLYQSQERVGIGGQQLRAAAQ